MLRVPLWAVETRDSRPVGLVTAKQIMVLDRHELAAGKLAALCARSASRDVFDAREMLARTDLDRAKLRLGFVVYGGINRKDWRAVRVDEIAADASEIERDLVPMLRSDIAPDGARVRAWTETLVRECRELMSAVLPLNEHEREFIECLNERGDIVPELLTSDVVHQATIREHPGLKWKALNVRRRTDRGLPR